MTESVYKSRFYCTGEHLKILRHRNRSWKWCLRKMTSLKEMLLLER